MVIKGKNFVFDFRVSFGIIQMQLRNIGMKGDIIGIGVNDFVFLRGFIKVSIMVVVVQDMVGIGVDFFFF